VDAAASGAQAWSQGGLWPVSDRDAQTNGAEARRSLLAKTGGCVRQNRVVLAPVAGVKSAEVFRAQPGVRSTLIAQGMPGCSDCTCMLVCVFSAHIARETAGAASARRSLRPRSGGRFLHSSGASRRGGAMACFPTVIARRRAIQYSRDVSDRTEKPRRTGSPACAGMTAVCGAIYQLHCEERSEEANHTIHVFRYGLLRGACHRAALCADPVARNDDSAF
jgi:hypothetical protein